MGTGWRRAFCTTIPKDRDRDKERERDSQKHQIPHTKLGLFSSASNPSTPRLQNIKSMPTLRCRTGDSEAPLPPPLAPPSSAGNTPRLRCKTVEKSSKSSNPSSPRSPFSILKNTLRLSRNGCGVCLQSVKTGQGTAVYTAECSHTFHFSCIAAHVRKHSSLICPVCNLSWKDPPLLSLHKSPPLPDSDDVVLDKTTVTAIVTASAPATPTGLSREVKTKLSERIYDDDEPLRSPIPGKRFTPIPEADEDEIDEEIDEFQGFFVNSTPVKKIDSCKSSYHHHRRVQRNVEVKLLPEAAVISVGRSHETFVVAMRVKAPPPQRPVSGGTTAALVVTPSHRAPIDLVTVLDLSGSMTGEKLQMLKRAMRLVISSLGSADRLAIVAFAGAPRRLMPLRRMTPEGQRSARVIIDRLSCGQGTAVNEALRKATKVLEDRREKNPVASIMLLSDGHDERFNNRSYQRHSSSHVSSTRFAHIEIPVHSSGFGPNRGNEPVEDAFAKCVGGLLSVVVQDLRVGLRFGSSSAPAQITAVYSKSNGRPTLMSSDSIRLGNLYAEEERELLIELKVPTSAAGSHHVMSVQCSYKDPVTQDPMYGKERALLVPRPHAVRSNDPRIERLRNNFIYTRAIAEARRLVEHNDFASAHHLLTAARAVLVQSRAGEVDHVRGVDAEVAEVDWRRQCQEEEAMMTWMLQRRKGEEGVDENGEPLTPTSAWRAAERLAKVAAMKKSLTRVSDLHGFENARF